jgi:uncharacterized HAD superfamily protein
MIWAYLIEHDNGFLLLCMSAFGMIWALLILFPTRLQFRHILAFALVSSAFLSVQFEQLNSFKEKEHRKLFASKLITKEDIDNDIKLLQVEKEMINAAAIDSFFYYLNNDYEEIELINQNLFEEMTLGELMLAFREDKENFIGDEFECEIVIDRK